MYTANTERDMEEELERTKVVKAFWDLRQEVIIKQHNFHFSLPCPTPP